MEETETDSHKWNQLIFKQGTKALIEEKLSQEIAGAMR